MAISPLDPAKLAKLPKSYLQENRGHELIDTAIVFIVLQTIAVTLFYISRYLTKTLNGIECWLFMPIAYIFNLGLCVCGILIVKLGGAGRHVAALVLSGEVSKVTTRNQIDKGVEFGVYGAVTGSKLVILCLYMRIFSTPKYRIATYVVGTIIILNWLAQIILSFSICTPFAFQWNKKLNGHCGDIMAAYTYISVPNIMTDVMMLVLPLPALYSLRMGLAAKIGLAATFMIGSAGVVTSILRMITFINSEKLFEDPTYNCIPTFIYSIAEAGTYLLAACMPTLRPLKRRVFPEHSFTKFLDTTLKKMSTKGSKTSYAPGSKTYGTGGSKGQGVLRTTTFQMQSMDKSVNDDVDGRTGSTEKLNDVGYLVTGKTSPGDADSKNSREYV